MNYIYSLEEKLKSSHEEAANLKSDNERLKSEIIVSKLNLRIQ